MWESYSETLWQDVGSKQKKTGKSKKQKYKKSAFRTIPDAVKIPGYIPIFPMVYYHNVYALNIIKFGL